jgi:hypothetical protein
MKKVYIHTLPVSEETIQEKAEEMKELWEQVRNRTFFRKEKYWLGALDTDVEIHPGKVDLVFEDFISQWEVHVTSIISVTRELLNETIKDLSGFIVFKEGSGLSVRSPEGCTVLIVDFWEGTHRSGDKRKDDRIYVWLNPRDILYIKIALHFIYSALRYHPQEKPEQ